MKRIISSWIFMCFVSTQLLGIAPQTVWGEVSAESAKPTRNLARDLASVSISGDIAAIEEVFQGKQDKAVILIRDAHDIPDAQRNIQKIITFFQKEYGNQLVGFEGASGAIDPQILQSFPDKDLLRDTLDIYFERGELTGTTAAAVLDDSQTVYQGIEDWDLYEEGHRYYLKAIAGSEDAAEQIGLLKSEFLQEKKSIYSEQLFEADQLEAKFKEDPSAWIEVLTRLAEIKLPETDSEIAVLLNSIQRDEKGNFVLETEVRKMAKALRESLPEARPALNQKYQAFQTSQISIQEFALFLKETADSYNVPFQMSPELASLTDHVKRLHDIQGAQFLQEFEDYMKSVKQPLFRNDEERALDERSRKLDVLEKLAQLKLTRDEWTQQQEGSITPEDSTKDLLRYHRAFYENAVQRDDAFFRNLMQFMRDSKSKASSALLIAGGFHTQGVTEQLKANGISYLLIAPAIESIPEQIHYQDHMQGDVSWKQYFKVQEDGIHLYEAFIRGIRDELLSQAKQRGKTSIPKRWRDQMIRDLAHQGEILKVKEYTFFLDELTSEKGVLPLRRFEQFSKGLRRLEAGHQITKENLFHLLQPSHMGPVYYHAAMVPIQRLSVGARSETRALNELEKRQRKLFLNQAIRILVAGKEEKIEHVAYLLAVQAIRRVITDSPDLVTMESIEPFLAYLRTFGTASRYISYALSEIIRAKPEILVQIRGGKIDHPGKDERAFDIVTTPGLLEHVEEVFSSLDVEDAMEEKTNHGTESTIKGMIVQKAYRADDKRVPPAYIPMMKILIIPTLEDIETPLKDLPTLGIETADDRYYPADSDNLSIGLAQIALANFLRDTPIVSKGLTPYDYLRSMIKTSELVKWYRLKASPTVDPIFILQLDQWDELGVLRNITYDANIWINYLPDAPFIILMALLQSLPVFFLDERVKTYRGGKPDGNWVVGGIAMNFPAKTMHPRTGAPDVKTNEKSGGGQTDFLQLFYTSALTNAADIGEYIKNPDLIPRGKALNPVLVESYHRLVDRGVIVPGQDTLWYYRNDLPVISALTAASIYTDSLYGLERREDIAAIYESFRSDMIGEFKKRRFNHPDGEEINAGNILELLRAENIAAIYERFIRDTIEEFKKGRSNLPDEEEKFIDILLGLDRPEDIAGIYERLKRDMIEEINKRRFNLPDENEIYTDILFGLERAEVIAEIYQRFKRYMREEIDKRGFNHPYEEELFPGKFKEPGDMHIYTKPLHTTFLKAVDFYSKNPELHLALQKKVDAVVDQIREKVFDEKVNRERLKFINTLNQAEEEDVSEYLITEIMFGGPEIPWSLRERAIEYLKASDYPKDRLSSILKVFNEKVVPAFNKEPEGRSELRDQSAGVNDAVHSVAAVLRDVRAEDTLRWEAAEKTESVLLSKGVNADAFLKQLEAVFVSLNDQDERRYIPKAAYETAVKDALEFLKNFIEGKLKDSPDQKFTLVVDIPNHESSFTLDDLNHDYLPAIAKLKGFIHHLILNGKLKGEDGQAFIQGLKDHEIRFGVISRLNQVKPYVSQNRLIPAISHEERLVRNENPTILPIGLKMDLNTHDPHVLAYAGLLQFVFGIVAAAEIKDPKELQNDSQRVEAELIKAITLFEKYPDINNIISIANGSAVISLRAAQLILEHLAQETLATYA